MKKISIVVPCYNEEENILIIYYSLKKVISTISSYCIEIIFIDNCSLDNSPIILRELAKKDKKVKVILNNRNFGPEMSGFHALCQASGDAIIGLACDMQDPPELIPQFIEEWEKGAKVVLGQKKTSHESCFKFFLRTCYYKLIRLLSALPQYEHITGFGLYDKKVIAEAKMLNDPWPMLRNIIVELGYIPVFIQYDQRKRERGKSSYNFFRYFDTALNGLVHTTTFPLQLAVYLGFIFSCISGVIGAYYFIYKIFFWDSFELGIAPLLVLLSFLASLILFFLGVLGQYVLLILRKVNFNYYVIEKERINFDE